MPENTAMQVQADKLLNEIKEDLNFYSAAIKEVSHEVLDSQFSEYPIFIAHQHEVHAGELILDRKELGRYWSINATTLEELEEKNYFNRERVQYFKKVFKDPRQYMCVLLITSLGGNIIFHPYSSAI